MNEFKVGDWVIGKRSKNPICIETIGTTLTNSSVTINGTFSVDQFTLWQPKLGEWCWFLSDTGTYHLLRFGGVDAGRYRGQTNYTASYPYEHCEPFIGELPSFLKEANNATN